MIEIAAALLGAAWLAGYCKQKQIERAVLHYAAQSGAGRREEELKALAKSSANTAEDQKDEAREADRRSECLI